MAASGALPLPLIVSHKTVDPKNDSSTAVVQLETAMGAAVQFFEGAGAISVPRTRFAPVPLLLPPLFHQMAIVCANDANRSAHSHLYHCGIWDR